MVLRSNLFDCRLPEVGLNAWRVEVDRPNVVPFQSVGTNVNVCY